MENCFWFVIIGSDLVRFKVLSSRLKEPLIRSVFEAVGKAKPGKVVIQLVFEMDENDNILVQAFGIATFGDTACLQTRIEEALCRELKKFFPVAKVSVQFVNSGRKSYHA
jgi:hypothetical protein